MQLGHRNQAAREQVLCNWSSIVQTRSLRPWTGGEDGYSTEREAGEEGTSASWGRAEAPGSRFLFVILFIFGCAESSLLCGLFSACGAWASSCRGFSCCGARQGTWTSVVAKELSSRAQARSLWPTGLVAPRQLGSTQIRDWTHVSWIGRHILYHWATRETLSSHFDIWKAFIKWSAYWISWLPD